MRSRIADLATGRERFRNVHDAAPALSFDSGDRTHGDIKGMYSFKGYKSLELSTGSWGHADGRVDLHARAGWRDATQVAYCGLGTQSPNERSNCRMQQWYIGGDAPARPAWPVVLKGALTYEDCTPGPLP